MKRDYKTAGLLWTVAQCQRADMISRSCDRISGQILVKMNEERCHSPQGETDTIVLSLRKIQIIYFSIIGKLFLASLQKV